MHGIGLGKGEPRSMQERAPCGLCVGLEPPPYGTGGNADPPGLRRGEAGRSVFVIPHAETQIKIS